MAKTAILMPYPALQEMAESLISRYPRLTPMCVEYVQTPQIHARAKSLEEKGCEIIIARGLQARIAREAVIIPVIEMRASTQELETMAMELKNRLPAGQEPPRMAIIGFFNMFHSTERFNEPTSINTACWWTGPRKTAAWASSAARWCAAGPRSWAWPIASCPWARRACGRRWNPPPWWDTAST